MTSLLATFWQPQQEIPGEARDRKPKGKNVEIAEVWLVSLQELSAPYPLEWLHIIKEAFGAGSVGKALARMFGPP